jgi:acyl CoA:acetate/3-ketoacid CoA transferase
MVYSGYFRAGGLELDVRDGAMRIVREGRHAKLVPTIEQVTFDGARALAEGRQALYVTERCVLELRPSGLTVTELAPGVDLDRDVMAQAGFALQVADDLRPMDPRLFRPEPMGLVLPENARRAALDRAIAG